MKKLICYSLIIAFILCNNVSNYCHPWIAEQTSKMQQKHHDMGEGQLSYKLVKKQNVTPDFMSIRTFYKKKF